MNVQSKAKIYLAENRGLSESENFRTYHTFNFGKYYNDERQPLGVLRVVNDHTLAAGQSLALHAEENCYFILLPLIGALNYTDAYGNQGLIQIGEMQVFHVGKGQLFQLANTHNFELINFLQIRLGAPGDRAFNTGTWVAFNIDENRNRLIELVTLKNSSQNSASRHKIDIGKFSGRNDAIYKKLLPQNHLFLFVIDGAFEVEGCLLHARDGLSLSGGEIEIEMEALSNDAIILVMELAA